MRVSEAEAQRLAKYVALLDRWNQRMNLTSLPLEGLPDSTIDRLLFEPLAAAQALGDDGVDWIDLGSGGGSPALPMKVRRPEAKLRLVESKARKAAFLREAVRALGLSGAEVVQARIEDLAISNPGSAEVVTVRGVRLNAELVASVRGLLRPGGRLLLFVREDAEAQDLAGFEQSSSLPLPGARLLAYAWAPKTSS
jgi:16S rRNA (guanine527-N7)-methyltransferase